MSPRSAQSNERLELALRARTQDDAPVVIAGGGIGGLATAIALAQRGIRSVVLERRASASQEGAGIQIGPNGTRVLRDLGVLETLRAQAGVPSEIAVHEGSSGRILTRLPLGRDIEQRLGTPYWVVHREDLHAALLLSARAHPEITLDVGVDVVASADIEGRAGCLTADDRVVSGQILVGADGIGSSVRCSVGPASLKAIGKTAYRCVLPTQALPAELTDGAVHIWLMPDAHVVNYPVRAGAETAVVLIAGNRSVGEGWSQSADPRERVAQLKASSVLKDLLLAVGSWRAWSLRVLDGPMPLGAGRIALVGDAAHPVLPFLAQGGVLALEDGMVLADCLANALDATAVSAYRQARQHRVHRVAAQSRRNGEFYHLTGAAALARNALLRMVPPQRLLRQYDWIYGFGARDV